jgi:hypothetical protein
LEDLQPFLQNKHDWLDYGHNSCALTSVILGLMALTLISSCKIDTGTWTQHML